jgi:ATP-dependent DNA helicase RecG
MAMTVQELEALVSYGESETLEFKETTGQRTEAARTVSAMLNGSGGTVLFGVTKKRQIVGQGVVEKTAEDVVRELKRIEPFVPISPEAVPLMNGRVVLILSVPAGRDRPYTFAGQPYVRQGPTTSEMPRDFFDRLLEERQHQGRRWETQPAYRLGVNDLDHAEITRTVGEAIRRGRMEEPGTRDPEALLLGLGLLQDGELLNAAIALFAKTDRLLPFYPQCILRMARFRGTTKDEFEDNRQIQGNTFQILVQAQRFLREHLPIAGRIVPNLFEREDDPVYPPEALREALANALCHRDYGVGGGAISLAIYDDRLEISSTGRLPHGLTPADLKRPHSSRPWNPLIASVFYRRGLVEQWGRGTLKIASLVAQAGLAAPEFEDERGEVVVHFFPTRYVPPSRISHDLNPFQQELLAVLASLGSVSLGEVMAALSNRVPRRTVQDNLQLLDTLGLVEHRGRGGGARWMLKGAVKP